MKYIFYGRVLPERVNFTLYPPITLTSEKYQLIVGSLYSKLTIECDNQDLELNLATLKNTVESAVRILVDGIGYTTACGFDVEIESAYDLSKKEITMFSVQEEFFDSEEDLKCIRDGRPPSVLGVDKEKICDLMGIDISLRLAMADFRESIRNPDVTAFHCMRAIESLKHSDFLSSKDSSQKLGQLKISLKITKKTMDKISIPGKDQRHGKAVKQSWQNRKEQMYITWEIIRRYLMLHINPKALNGFNDL